MTPAAWGIASGVLDVVSFVPYVIAVRRGTADPARVSWTIWAVEYAVLAVVQYARGGGAGDWIAVGELAGCVTLAVLSWRRGGDGFGRGQAAILAGALAGVAAWPLAGPGLAVVLTVAVEAAATGVTVVKVWRRPGSESLLSWWMFGAAALVDVPAVAGGPPVLWLYPVTGALTAAAVLAGDAAGRSAARVESSA